MLRYNFFLKKNTHFCLVPPPGTRQRSYPQKNLCQGSTLGYSAKIFLKKTNKYQMIFKNYQNLTKDILYCLLPMKKYLTSKSTTTLTSTLNLPGSIRSIWNFFTHCLIWTQCTWQLGRIILQFLSLFRYMKWWHRDKFHDFQTSFAIYRISKQFACKLVLRFGDQGVQNFESLSEYSHTIP
jgi:hypothetical protein